MCVFLRIILPYSMKKSLKQECRSILFVDFCSFPAVCFIICLLQTMKVTYYAYKHPGDSRHGADKPVWNWHQVLIGALFDVTLLILSCFSFVSLIRIAWPAVDPSFDRWGACCGRKGRWKSQSRNVRSDRRIPWSTDEGPSRAVSQGNDSK